MNSVGIIAEYNPFHNGHLYHITQSRQIAGKNSPVVCVMSGNFVQRGDVAIFNKNARAKAAILEGADLVFELPLPWALSSAEGFARGSIEILTGLGVKTLSFGSECGSIDELQIIANELIAPNFHEAVKDKMKTVITYAAARQLVLEERLGKLGKLIRTPNNILGIEYLKAIALKTKSESCFLDNMDGGSGNSGVITPITMCRKGAMHDMPGSGEIHSASKLRGMMEVGEDISKFVPAAALEVFRCECSLGRGNVTLDTLETALLSRLRALNENDFNSLPDATEGLGNRLYKAVRSEATLDGIFHRAKTKRYTMSRIRRLVLAGALGIKAGTNREKVPYARLLGASTLGCRLLREIKKTSKIPIVTKPASVIKLSKYAQEIFDLESSGTDLYVLGYNSREMRKGGTDFQSTPFIKL